MNKHTDTKVLQDDQNFLVEIIDWPGKKAIKKTAKVTAEKSRADRLQNDVLGMEFFTGLAKDNTLDLYMPEIYDHGPNFYIREYIPGDTLITNASDFITAKPRLDKQIKLLADLDKIKTDKQIGYVGSSNYKNLSASVPRWADENVQDGIISLAKAVRAKEIMQGLDVVIEPAIIHGDMSPLKHVYLHSDGRLALIDFENFSSTGARYFDVAWNYTRLYSFAKTTDIPRYFLAQFIEQSQGRENKEQQLFAVLLQRTLGMQKDAVSNFKDKDIDYRDRAKELLDLVLQNKLELLHT